MLKIPIISVVNFSGFLSNVSPHCVHFTTLKWPVKSDVVYLSSLFNPYASLRHFCTFFSGFFIWQLLIILIVLQDGIWQMFLFKLEFWNPEYFTLKFVLFSFYHFYTHFSPSWKKNVNTKNYY